MRNKRHKNIINPKTMRVLKVAIPKVLTTKVRRKENRKTKRSNGTSSGSPRITT